MALWTVPPFSWYHMIWNSVGMVPKSMLREVGSKSSTLQDRRIENIDVGIIINVYDNNNIRTLSYPLMFSLYNLKDKTILSRVILLVLDDLCALCNKVSPSRGNVPFCRRISMDKDHHISNKQKETKLWRHR